MRRLVLFVLLLVATGCGARSRSFDPGRMGTEAGWIAVPDVALVRQETRTDCGAAVLAMVFGHWKTEGFDRTSVPADERMKAGDMRDIAKARGLQAFLVTSSVEELQTQLGKGRPVIVGLVKERATHYEVVVALHPERRRVVLLDPARGWRDASVEDFLVEWEPSQRLALITFVRE